jgi:hypothetical membrane protein
MTGPVVLSGACWSLLVLFYVGQAVVQTTVTAPYSLLDNTFSDLGATTCGPIAMGDYRAEVCSPWHTVMNGTFLVSGLLTAAGAVSSWRAWPAGRRTVWGLALLVLSGAGEVFAGLVPQDVHPVAHVAGSIVGIVSLNVAVLLLGTALWSVRRRLAGSALLAGAVGPFGSFLAPATRMPTGLSGRLAGYPGVVWLIAAGLLLLRLAPHATGARPAAGVA